MQFLTLAQTSAGGGEVAVLTLIGAVLVLLIQVAILRWIFRINDMVKYQRQMAEALAALRRHFDAGN